MGMAGGCDSDKPSFVEWVIIVAVIVELLLILLYLIGDIK
mgnify:CR=1 FL=1